MALQFGLDQKNPKYDQRGMLIPGTGGLPAAPSQTYAPLPAVGPAAPPMNDPIQKFNMGILDLLSKAQTMDTSALINERDRLALGQTTDSMKPAGELGLEGLTPGAALAARGRTADLYNPEINNLTSRVQASVQAVNQFKQAIDAAKEYGDEIAKTVKPDQETINAVQEMLIAGQNPGQDVLNSVSKYIDWKKVGAAKQEGKTSNEREYERAKAEGAFKGNFQQWLDRPSQYKGDGAATTKSKLKPNTVIAEPRKAPAGFVGPVDSKRATFDYFYVDENLQKIPLSEEQYRKLQELNKVNSDEAGTGEEEDPFAPK